MRNMASVCMALALAMLQGCTDDNVIVRQDRRASLDGSKHADAGQDRLAADWPPSDVPVWPDQAPSVDARRDSAPDQARDTTGGDQHADTVSPIADGGNSTQVTIPVYCGAGYPFADACYDIYVTASVTESYSGKINTLWYGFTKSSLADYQLDNNVPWVNAAGQPTHEGSVTVAYKHDGGYKGNYVIDPPLPKVTVPPGLNFVFSFTYDTYSGDCSSGGSTWVAKLNSKTYFVQVAP